MNSTPLHKLIKICIGIILIGGFILVYFRFIDGTIVNPVVSSFGARQYETTQKTYNPGDDVIVYSSAFCKYRGVSTTVNWELEDDVLLTYPPKSPNFPAGCYDSSKQIDVGVLPDYIGGHTYKFVGTITYHLYGRDITTQLSTTSFYVNPKKTAAQKAASPQNSSTPPAIVPPTGAPQSQNTSDSNTNPPPAETVPVISRSIVIPILNLRIPL